MFIHLGNDNVIRSEDVIAIIDYQMISSSVIMGEMMKAWKREKKIIGTMKDAKSIMITTDLIYYTTVSVSTLKRRSSINHAINNLDDYSEEVIS
ncbi:extracellular matrix regulator RemB [Oceanobacillus senegalensis]|uniref:extracellular matrix regulator RemB n=1 Tax=Oceanobacillus senegalensis TaxID=1936063 RepID=UPI000A309E52|nr:extracellular matrix/biofilm biosynthesis regulator RemA family protein [Oceanobacillus senegalensis]